MLYYSLDNYQACRLEMVWHAHVYWRVDHRVTARKWTSADLMLGQRRDQVRWEGDIDQSALEHACQSDWRWFVADHIGIKIYLCNTIKSNIIT